MADEAIGYMGQLDTLAPDQPWLVYYAPGGTHAPHHPTPEWIDKIEAMHLFDERLEPAARHDLRQPEAAGRDPARLPS